MPDSEDMVPLLTPPPSETRSVLDDSPVLTALGIMGVREGGVAYIAHRF